MHEFGDLETAEERADTMPTHTFYQCTYCGADVRMGDFCALCVAIWDALPHPLAMSGEQIETEMRQHGGRISVPLELVKARLCALVGRPVFTHEIGLAFEELIEEAKGARLEPPMEQILSLIPDEKRIVIGVD